MMHLTCTNMPRASLRAALERVKADGIRNILALRGDPPKGAASFEAVEGGFSCALDLVNFIKAEFGDEFGITVAGYPEAHPDAIKEDPEEQKVAYAAELAYLKRKCDAGGEVIVTQLFYDVDLFLKFVSDCRSVGITAPIVPGVMPIQTYGGFKRMTGFCKTYVPPAVAAALEPIAENEEAVRAYGVHLGVQMCRTMLDSGTPGVHLYSLNSPTAVVAILQGLGLVSPCAPPHRHLPWRAPVSQRNGRCGERVRPVFWALRPRAYLARSADASWPLQSAAPDDDSLPSSLAPVSSELLDALRPKGARAAAARVASLTRPLRSAADVRSLFDSFSSGELDFFPWAESGKPSPELVAAASAVSPLSARGVCVIDAGLARNGVPSSDSPAGWGPPNGRLYAKAFLLAFVPTGAVERLAAAVNALPGGGSHLSCAQGGAVAGTLARAAPLTWASAPGGPLLQPVSYSRPAFEAYAGEAWALWAEWEAAAGADEAGEAAKAALREARLGASLFWAVAEDVAAGEAQLFEACLAC